MPERIEAILWDNDGVLVDTERIYFQVTRQVLEEVGASLDEKAYREFFLYESSGAWHLARELGYGADDVERLRERRNELYAQALLTADVAIEGVREVLDALRPQYRMAVVTSSRRLPFEIIHERTGFLEFFEFALVREEYARSKPDPEPFLMALERLGLPAEACVVIEDSERGLRAANAAGIPCWIIPNELSAGSDFTSAERILDDIRDVARYLR